MTRKDLMELAETEALKYHERYGEVCPTQAFYYAFHKAFNVAITEAMTVAQRKAIDACGDLDNVYLDGKVVIEIFTEIGLIGLKESDEQSDKPETVQNGKAKSFNLSDL